MRTQHCSVPGVFLLLEALGILDVGLHLHLRDAVIHGGFQCNRLLRPRGWLGNCPPRGTHTLSFGGGSCIGFLTWVLCS